MTQVLPERVPDQLPDFRNLGVMLRTLLTVNIAAIAACIAASNSLYAIWPLFRDAAAVLEPTLLLVMGVLAALGPWLHRQSYGRGALLTMALALASAITVRSGLVSILPTDAMAVGKTVVYTAGLTWGLLAYFQLRGRAMSPLLTEARLQALQARIRPHFLFNSLNAVLSLIRKEPMKAEHALEDLADLFRVFMAENRDLMPLAREMDLARQYLGIELLRLGDRLQVEWHTDKMPGDALIPPLTLQPLLENAVYHGIEPSAAPGIIAINVYRARDEVHIDIRNPYFRDGGQHHAGNKMAMGNIRERLALHFDAEASLKTTVGSDYYQVHITLPYRPGRKARHDRPAQSFSG
ncbi:sensor histidine kinase [Chitinimonas sp.]|uniref:sensor histidine kinase n=1 Tax=Chitinimonas sp. TaxID=1934313 RepID=UPI0035B3F88C